MDNASLPSRDNHVSWYGIFVNTVGFIIGFILGGFTGYFGNWLWYKFGPKNKKPHFTMTTTDGKTSFSGVLNQDNMESVLKSMRAACGTYKKEESPKKYPLKEIPTQTSSGSVNVNPE
jgi:hypothetical protein